MAVLKILKESRVSAEIVHYFDDDLLITSVHRLVSISSTAFGETLIELPRSKLDFLGFSRLARRLLRLDKCNVVPINVHDNASILIRQGVVYKYDHENGLRPTLKLRQSRNVLHTDFCRTQSGRWVFGEYGANSERHSVPIYASDNDGETWYIAHEIPAGKAKHIHGVYMDPHSEHVWVFTGDEDGESWVIKANEDFSEVIYIGDGSQTYRACTAFFLPDKVVWAMDSPLQPSKMVHYDRESGEINVHSSFPGPIWYGLEIPSRGYLVASTVEPGEAVIGKEAGIYFSEDLIHWSRISAYTKDHWPIGIFKFGVISFSRGTRSDGAFFVHGEALQGLDGVSIRCRLDG